MSILYKPQPGPQEKFLSSDADITIYGGAAGAGKSFSLLLDALRGIKNSSYHAVLFRRLAAEIRKVGQLWDASKKIYTGIGNPNNVELKWTFGQYSNIQLSGLQYDQDVYSWQGAELDFIGFDELTTFTENQFWYLFSRLRSSSGQIKPYMRATCNPQPGWLLDLIEWWIREDGYPDENRAGVKRYFVRFNGVVNWFSAEKEAQAFIESLDIDYQMKLKIKPKTMCFIPATIEDNQYLLQNNPDYVSTLFALPEIEKKRLLEGNWRIMPSGRLFKREWFKQFVIMPKNGKVAIFVDTAQETGTANDFTVMQVWIEYDDKLYLVDQFRDKVEFLEQVEQLALMCTKYKPTFVAIEKKANGSALIQTLRGRVPGIKIRPIERKKDKYTRGYECQGYVESGYVYLNQHLSYYYDFMSEVVQFAPENKNKNVHDDQVDCMMDAIEQLLINKVKTTQEDVLLKVVKYDTNKFLFK